MSDIVQQAKQATVKPQQDIVAPTSEDFRKELLSSISGGVRDLIIDLEGVQVVDSDGIAAFIATHKLLNEVGGKLTVCNASQDIWEFFRIMRLNNHFTVTTS